MMKERKNEMEYEQNPQMGFHPDSLLLSVEDQLSSSVVEIVLGEERFRVVSIHPASSLHTLWSPALHTLIH